jgi:hypothetical protein
VRHFGAYHRLVIVNPENDADLGVFVTKRVQSLKVTQSLPLMPEGVGNDLTERSGT